jgi:aspartyl-tRNA(Asn)/glutamyl-tRNA(Gln) amidotransferase subunit A
MLWFTCHCSTSNLLSSAFDNYFLKAQTLRQRVKADFDHIFAAQNVLSSTAKPECGPEVDILLHPSAIRTAPHLPHENSDAEDALSGLDAYTQDVLTVPASLAGLPALSMPVGLGTDGWPIGVTVAGQWGCDDMVLQVGTEVERVFATTDATWRHA